ncbi:reverse transcriptase [Hamiltosporidium tvaerminnensis]|uniref:Reverse transcriptase n=1 Tax=Hamiltosporidium tvaerminnensis TaxID=1176355 RepID=A0A4V2JYB8_9MICR|nr:reverse transcriptase [Hamiltosporidium tvaerminnensis]
MGRRKKVDSENIKNEKIKAVKNLKSPGEIFMCDVDVAMLSERLPPLPTFQDTTHQPPSSSCQTSPVCLVETIPSSSGTDATAFGPANGMTNLNTDALLEGNRLMVLHTILDSVTVVEQECPRSAILAVQKRFERMPRNGWPATLRYYNEKFSCTLDIDSFKKLAQNEAEKEMRQEENGERRRIATFLTEPCTLTDTTEYINLRDKFLSKIKEISENEIRKVVVRTRKLPSELVDSKVLDLINRIIGEYADSCVPMTITAVARIIQAAQKPRSAWKENIESKISKLVLSKDLLEKAQFNLNLSSVTDLSEALVKKNESLNVYEKKITMYENNRMFELYRGRFYRGLSKRGESEHVVSRDEIVSFWSTIWNKNDETVTYIIIIFHFWLSNGKAAGIDGIYNFFIKKLTTHHKYIYDIVKVIYLEGTPQVFGIPRRGSDYRPITCMSNLYKLTTKCVTKVVQIEVERRGLLAENQLGAVRGVQGAKEQALLNIALNKEYGNNLKATWIDVKKAYDSIDHAYLTQCIENLNLPDWLLKFIKVIISKWKIYISVGPEKIMSKKIKRGIPQGDSLSPLLFVVCMDPLSRKLNEKYTKVKVQTDAESHSTNQLCFIDDLKLLAKDSSTLSAITDEAKEFLEVIGLEINKEKSATNDTCCEDTATFLEDVSVYKYYRIIEHSRGIPTRSSFEEIHLRPRCKERLYLSRTELGRGLHSIELQSEHMLLQLLDCLEKSKEISTRRAAILKVENNNKTHLALIKGFLKVNYRLVEEVIKKSLEEAQLAKLYNEIEKRKLYSKLYNARKNELVSVTVFCYIQDKNVFWGADGMCQHCNKSGHDYTRRHNEVVRCLHLLLLNRYKFKSSKRIRSHSVQEILDNEIKTDVKIRNNRPDIFLLYKKKNKITLIEVGITSQDSLQIVETEKLRKYDLLANELCLFYKCSVDIIPYVMTWDGIVTKYPKKYVKRLQIPMNEEALYNPYILSVILRAEMHKQPIPPLKEATTVKEPKININEESDLEEDIQVVEEII